MVDETLRLQVVLSRSGVCSRRRAFTLVQEGRVLVNGEVVRDPGRPVRMGGDEVVCDGRPVVLAVRRYIVMNKPRGVVTTRGDRFAGRTVMDLLPEDLRSLHPAGRLDKDTEGMLLLTDDGPVTLALTHPRFGVEKVYEAHVDGRVAPSTLRRLERGILIDGRRTAPARAGILRSRAGGTVLRLVVHEGRKRLIRRMLAAVGHPVEALRRIAQGPLRLRGLKPGAWRPATSFEVAALRRLAEGKTSGVPRRSGRKRGR